MPLRMKDVARGRPTRKELKIFEKKDMLGVCLIGKRSSSGSFRAVCSGSVVRGLLGYDGSRVFIIASDHIVLKEDLGELQSGRKTLNTSDYRLYFKTWYSANELKIYELHKVTNPKDKVRFISGLAIIALDAKKLRRRSGILSYRPFAANKEETESLGGSVCQIVDGNTDAFAVTPYDLEYIEESREYVLKLPEKEVIIKTWSKLTAKGVSNLHPCGAVILRSGGAVGVLNFVGEQISPVLLSQLQPFGECYYVSVKYRPRWLFI